MAEPATLATRTAQTVPEGNGFLTRRATLAPATADPEARTVEVVWSTGAPVRRRDMAGQYIERLSLDGAKGHAWSGRTFGSHARGVEAQPRPALALRRGCLRP